MILEIKVVKFVEKRKSLLHLIMMLWRHVTAIVTQKKSLKESLKRTEGTSNRPWVKSALLTGGWLCIISNQEPVALMMVHLVEWRDLLMKLEKFKGDNGENRFQEPLKELKRKLCSTQLHTTRWGSETWPLGSSGTSWRVSLLKWMKEWSATAWSTWEVLIR